MNYLATKPGLVIFGFTFLIILFLDKVLIIENTFLRASIAVFIAIIISPKRKIIETQSGKKKQYTWLFLKEPIIKD